MKQWNSKGVFALSMLSFSLVAGSAHAQVAGSDGNTGNIATDVDNSNRNVEDNRRESNVITSQNVPVSLHNSRIDSQPVYVTPGMAPTVVSPSTPIVIAAPRGNIDRQSNEPSISFASPGTGIGGSNPGNANTGGVQVQSVNVSTAQESNLSAASRADMIRRERLRAELDNETRLIEKVEEGRLEDERSRTGAITTFSAASAKASAASNGSSASAQSEAQASAGTLVTVPVAPIGASASATAIAQAGGAGISTEYRDDAYSKFAVMPFVGHRWLENGNTQFKVNNVVVTGANLSGQMNQFLSLEGSFTYGRDEMKTRYGFGGYNGANYGGGFAGQGQGYYGQNQGGCCNTGNYAGSYGPQANAPFDYIRSRDTFDVAANAKLGLFEGKFRPYGLAGIGGSMQHYNIDNSYTVQQAHISGFDRNTSHVTAQFGGGVDVEVANRFTVGARFDYQRIFDSNKYLLMNQLYGDGMSRYSLVGNVSVLF